MGKIKGLVTEMGYDSAKRYLEEIKRKLERDKERSKHAVSNDKKITKEDVAMFFELDIDNCKLKKKTFVK